MASARDSPNRRRYITALTVWLGTCVSCALAIVYFYSLLRGHDIYPIGRNRGQCLAAARTAVIATIFSLWAIWIGTKQECRRRMALWRTGLGIQISLTLFATAGWQITKSLDLQIATTLDLIFPSTFFAEYNWLTFILEVAPATAVAAAVLLYLCSRHSSAREIA